MRHADKTFRALIALCALALPCAAQVGRDARAGPQPRQSGARVKRVTLGRAAGAAVLPKQTPLPRVESLSPLGTSAPSAAFADSDKGAGARQLQSSSLAEHVRLSARRPYAEGKGSRVFAEAITFNAMFDRVSLGSGRVYATPNLEPGKQYIIEPGIHGGNIGKDNPHPVAVAIGPGVAPFINAEKSVEETLEYGSHQLLFEYTPKNADPVVVGMRAPGGITFHYCRVLSVQ